MNENYDFFLKIGIDGERDVGKSYLVSKFTNDNFNGVYKDTLHAYVTTTHLRFNNYTIKVEFLETGWNLRPNKNYYSYIDGAIFVYNTSNSEGLNGLNELLREYSSYVTYKIPIMIIANNRFENTNKNKADLLHEVKNYIGEKFLFDVTLHEERTGDKLNKILEECISRFSDFREIKDLRELTFPSSQFKSMIEYTTRFYSFEIPKKVIYNSREQIEGLTSDEIKSFLCLERLDLYKGGDYGDKEKYYYDGKLYRYYGEDYYYRYKKEIIKDGIFKKNENKHTIIMLGNFEIPENLKKILEKAINDVKESPETLKKAIDYVKESPEILEHQELKKYFQKLDQQLKDLEKVSKIEDFNMSNLAFNILSSLANLKTKIGLFVEKVNYLNLESIFLNEIDSITSEIDKYLKLLPEWNDYCIIIINQFEVLNNFVKNIEDSLFYFEIQEKLLPKIGEIKEELFNKSETIHEYETKKKNSFRSKYYKEQIKQDEDAVYLNFLFTIGLKSVYDLIVELECIAKKLKLLDSTSIQKILDFLKKLNYELKQTELVDLIEIYKKSELCLKDCCLDYIVEKLSKLACLINNFCKQIVVDKSL